MIKLSGSSGRVCSGWLSEPGCGQTRYYKAFETSSCFAPSFQFPKWASLRFLGILAILVGMGGRHVGAQSATFAGNAQHTGQYNATAQHLNAVRWTTSVDLVSAGGGSHYGAPLITPSN